MGYKIFDGATLSPTAVELPYVIGTLANTAIANSWPSVGSGLPVPTEEVRFLCTQDVYLRFVTLETYLYIASGDLGAVSVASLVQQYFVANTWHTVPANCIIIYYQRVAVDGTLYFNSFA